MRKIFFTLLLLLTSCALFSQAKVDADKQTDTQRFISTSPEKFAVQKHGVEYECNLSLFQFYEEDYTKNVYLIGFDMLSTVIRELHKGAKLLIKFDNDSIIELYTYSEITAKNYITKRIGYSVFYSYSLPYEVSEDQLQYIINNKIEKIRMEVDWGQGYIDYDKKIFNKYFDLSSVLDRMKYAIDDRLKKNNTIYDGF